MTGLPSLIKTIRVRHRLSTKLILGHITYPLKILKIVFRSHPSTIVRVSSLTIGSNGKMVLGDNGRTMRSYQTLITTVGSKLTRTNFSPTTIRLLAAHRRARTVLTLSRCLSLVVPHKSGTFIRFIRGGAHVPILNRTSNVYRLCISHRTSVTGTAAVTMSTGTTCPSTYGTVRALLLRQSVTTRTLPILTRKLQRTKMRLQKSRTTHRVLPSLTATARRS